MLAAGSEPGEPMTLGNGSRLGHPQVTHRCLLGTRSGVFNQLIYRLFASPRRAARLYPGLKACRNTLLRLCRIPPIDHLRR